MAKINSNFVSSKSTDKLVVMNGIIERTLDELSSDKKEKLKTIDIVWKTVGDDGYSLEHPLPELKINFFE